MKYGLCKSYGTFSILCLMFFQYVKVMYTKICTKEPHLSLLSVENAFHLERQHNLTGGIQTFVFRYRTYISKAYCGYITVFLYFQTIY